MSRRTESMLMARVDAARNLARTPGKGQEAQGRMFVAKRCHELAKAGQDVAAALPALLAEVLDSLEPASHDGARAEAALVLSALS